MLVINHLGLRHAWLIPTHHNSKPLLMSRHTTVTHILFLNLRTQALCVSLSKRNLMLPYEQYVDVYSFMMLGPVIGVGICLKHVILLL